MRLEWFAILAVLAFLSCHANVGIPFEVADPGRYVMLVLAILIGLRAKVFLDVSPKSRETPSGNRQTKPKEGNLLPGRIKVSQRIAPQEPILANVGASRRQELMTQAVWLFIVMATLSSILSENPLPAFLKLFVFALQAFLFGVLCPAKLEAKQWNQVIRALQLMLLFAVGLALYKGQTDMGAWHQGFRLGGISNPNSVGLVAMASGVMLLWDLEGENKATGSWDHRLVWIALAASLWVLWKTYSRSSLGGFAAGMAVWVLTSDKGRRYAYLMLAAVVVMYLVDYTPVGIISDFQTNLWARGSADVLSSRYSVWEQSIEGWKENPWFGHGYGLCAVATAWQLSTMAFILLRDGAGYLGLLESVGLFGVLAMGLIIFFVSRGIWQMAHLPRPHKVQPAFMKAASLFVALLLQGIGEPWIIAPGSFGHILFWLSIGGITAACLQTHSPMAPALSPLPVHAAGRPPFRRLPSPAKTLSPRWK